jgi:DEAD/DEAH box helicase domain-containing protein
MARLLWQAVPPNPIAAPPPWHALLAEGRRDGRLVREAREGPRDAVLTAAPTELHPEVLAALDRAGVRELYSHQAQAIAAAWEGTTIVTTGTASGKSLCFNVPTLHTLCSDAFARALYLYPTKALAQDQARAIGTFGLGHRVRPAIYDGDTPREARAQIRRRANLILTNPDMLHMAILPNHPAWETLLRHLEVIVVDEAHVYRGVFGSHVGNVLRRLRRLAAFYRGDGTEPRILLASATIGNPVELAERLTGHEDVTLVDQDGAPGPRRQIAMWNPPITDEALGARRSTLAEAADLLVELVAAGSRVICFIRSRRAVELTSRLAADQLAGRDPDLAERIVAYRAGYTPAQRRDIEARLTSGEIRAVVTTTALELGIDIGTLDAAIVVGFPGTIASLRQMWGRAGRRGHGLALYIAGEDALDQFFVRHPDEFLDRPVEMAILDHESEEIHLAQMQCAAHELPLTATDAEFLGPRWQAYAERLVSTGVLRERTVRGRPSYVLRDTGDYPAGRVALRSASMSSVAIVELPSGEVIGTTEASRAPGTLHPGAVYLHQGRSYEVTELDLDVGRAIVEPFTGDWYTQPKIDIDLQIDRLLDRRTTLGVTLSLGRLTVTETVLAYQRRRLRDHAVVDLRGVGLPESTFTTIGLWYELDDDALEELPVELLLGALHATEHAQIAVLPLLAMCDRWDIGGLSTNLHSQTGGPTIFIYDGHPGGIGITRQAFKRFEELVTDAHRLIGECGCEHGCPSCVQSPKCGNLNEPLSKAGAAVLMATMLGSSGPTGGEPAGAIV